ncbi:uncharacterized protein PgNI_07533 [Pyricularia grisea]|uniref:DUF202 domain-containing protein n=1 Tax=Pyricularia grisea TaxID=148305 RepID=A0A6P8B1U0_PYRGI|nr:uncharacterized protein PgNI_07533 [Pyricularia grisea]TLD08870.1 hypothetical protein PgNI_07533 [Pyricularia grisea]
MDRQTTVEPTIDEEDLSVTCCAPARAAFDDLTRPIVVGESFARANKRGDGVFFAWPFLGPLLFENEASDCRDHCANERTFLSYLRLAMFMALVSAAIILSFHLKLEPTEMELRMAKPLGLIFWALSTACLGLGLTNYIKTIDKYGRRAALVQSGWKTQSILTLIVVTIVGTCVTLLVINKLVQN